MKAAELSRLGSKKQFSICMEHLVWGLSSRISSRRNLEFLVKRYHTIGLKIFTFFFFF